ncbi:MAG: hypothetical protein WBE34_07395 [Candidatus Nitrosopolaris sp.]
MTANLPEKGHPSKKERIHELFYGGNYSDQQIANIVGTSVANVYKEKSTLRKSGFLLRHKVERSDRTLLVAADGQDLYASNPNRRKGPNQEYQELLSIPPIEPEGMKKLYSDLNAGKKPFEIIAAHGFHPAVVETEYHRSQKLHNDILVKRIMSEVLIWKTSEKGTALIDKYQEQGYLHDDELIELLKEYTSSMQQFGAEIERNALGLHPSAQSPGKVIG